LQSLPQPLTDFLERAVGLSWVLHDILGSRVKLAPVTDADLRALIDVGLVEVWDDASAKMPAGLTASHFIGGPNLSG
jgi:hypothetical protein